MACLKAQHANVLGELQPVGKKAVQYLHDLHSAESVFVPTERNCLSLRVVASSYHNHSPLSICFLRPTHLQLLSLPLYTTRWGKGGHTLIPVFQIPVRQPVLIETLQSPQNTVLLTPSPAMIRPPLPWRGKRETPFRLWSISTKVRQLDPSKTAPSVLTPPEVKPENPPMNTVEESLLH